MNKIKEDLTGRRFGKLLVDSRKRDDHGKIGWLCKCDCGSEVIVATSHLTKNGQRRCINCPRNKELQTCLHCQIKFPYKKSVKFCSRACSRQHKVEMYEVEFNGKLFACFACRETKINTEFNFMHMRWAHYSVCKLCSVAAGNKWFIENKNTKALDNKLRREFGITLQDYNELLAKQGGTCAICKEQETVGTGTGKIRRLCVDHNHETGKVRGLLCAKHNAALGLIKDSVDTIDKIIEYILKHEQNNLKSRAEQTL